jgi:hypothetical protein
VKCSIKNVGTKYVGTNTSGSCVIGAVETACGAKQYKEARVQFDRARAIGGLGARDLGLPSAKACALDHDAEAAMAWLKTIPAQFLPYRFSRMPPLQH